jgi:hypothetical protein
MTAPEARENLNRKPQLRRGALAGQRLAEPGIQIALGPSDEPLMLLEEGPQPWMVVLSEEVRDHKGPRDAIADQTIG